MTDSTMTAIPLVERLERPLVIEHAVPTPVHEVLQRAPKAIQGLETAERLSGDDA